MKRECAQRTDKTSKHGLDRRSFLKRLSAAAVVYGTGSRTKLRLARLQGQPDKKTHVAVIGAGAFGGWTALYLLRAGTRVTLVDEWGPGNSRASSSGETRIIRATYGPTQPYTKIVARALQLWVENERRWNMQLYNRTGVLWLPAQDDQFERGSLTMLREAGLNFEELSSMELVKRYPQINLEGVKWAIHETNAGYLTARRACEAVLAGFIAEGGRYQQLAVREPRASGGEVHQVTLSDGSQLSADAYVFACGPWLGKLFPDVIGDLITPTRQEVFFFGTAAGDSRFSEEQLPAWIDHGIPPFYGIPNNQWRGFKIANDTRGPVFDPTTGERTPTPEGIKEARKYIAFRFPLLKDAPLLESRVCQYENSPDHNLIIDRHPRAGNLWLVGGGSGHGFKQGPAVGEMVANLVVNQGTPLDVFKLARFSKAAAR